MDLLTGDNGERDERATPAPAPRDLFERLMRDFCPTLWDVLACAPGRRTICLNEMRNLYAAASAQVLGLTGPWPDDGDQ